MLLLASFFCKTVAERDIPANNPYVVGIVIALSLSLSLSVTIHYRGHEQFLQTREANVIGAPTGTRGDISLTEASDTTSNVQRELNLAWTGQCRSGNSQLGVRCTETSATFSTL